MTIILLFNIVICFNQLLHLQLMEFILNQFFFSVFENRNFFLIKQTTNCYYLLILMVTLLIQLLYFISILLFLLQNLIFSIGELFVYSPNQKYQLCYYQTRYNFFTFFHLIYLCSFPNQIPFKYVDKLFIKFIIWALN